MSLSLPATTRPDLPTMIGIEARRFAKHPLFLIGFVAAIAVTVLVTTSGRYANDMLSMPIVPAFFIGLTSLVTAARLTRSTESATEAIGTAPGSEADRTLALAGACLVPFTAGVIWLVEILAIISIRDSVHPNELWFGTLGDLQVWAILIALGPIACLGGGLVGVLVGRWLKFPGASAVVVVALVVLDLIGQVPFINEANPSPHGFRLYVPWAMFHSGSLEDGTQILYAGNAVAYLGYLLALCGLAVVGAVWHDRSARTSRVRSSLFGLIAAAIVLFALAALTGPDAIHSQPIPG
jgi:hypothetical protein